MTSEINDDRTEEQKREHSILVMMEDSFMSGWGKASGGKSFAAWACCPDDVDNCREWVESRKDALSVFETDDEYVPDCVHLHIYVWDKGEVRS